MQLMSLGGFNRYALYGESGTALPPEFVHLERIFDRSSLHDWTIAPHAHPHMLQLLLIESGVAHVHGDTAMQSVEGPALIVVPAACVHAFHFEPAVEGWVFSLAADMINDPRTAGLLTGFAHLQHTQAHSLAGHPAAASRLNWLLTDLAEQQRAGQAAGPGLLAQVALILVTALQAVSQAGTPASQQAHSPLVARFRTLVEAHYRDHWAVTAYAAALGTTASTLTRATRALTGQAPADLLHDRLLLEAKRNLAFTGASVAQIAYALGFADPAYFARFFKARSGQTASRFRHNLVWSDGERRDREPS
ncbi:helix-turn-helix domain-containing protein [Novosphingobium sp. ERN07]|nr:helix-turn-helix domain-containing protein [Novosphingobium sp. ERN07]